uniref:Uncharacterized protein n=1 Tax=Arion vulgaris TaxID=1028688 RepID=A0A0B7BFN9_9EUPU
MYRNIQLLKVKRISVRGTCVFIPLLDQGASKQQNMLYKIMPSRMMMHRRQHLISCKQVSYFTLQHNIVQGKQFVFQGWSKSTSQACLKIHRPYRAQYVAAMWTVLVRASNHIIGLLKNSDHSEHSVY